MTSKEKVEIQKGCECSRLPSGHFKGCPELEKILFSPQEIKQAIEEEYKEWVEHYYPLTKLSKAVLKRLLKE